MSDFRTNPLSCEGCPLASISFADCKHTSNEDCKEVIMWLSEHDKQITKQLLAPYDVESIEELVTNSYNKGKQDARAEVIEEYKLKLLNAKTDLVNDIDKAKIWVEFKRQAIDIAEQLKERNK